VKIQFKHAIARREEGTMRVSGMGRLATAALALAFGASVVFAQQAAPAKP